MAGYIYSSPAVVGGFVYVGTSQHNLYIYNATNGHFVCKFPISGQILTSPMVVNPDGSGPVAYFGDSGVSGGLADGGSMWAITAAGNPAGPCHLKWQFDAYGDPAGSLTGQAGDFASPAFGVDPKEAREVEDLMYEKQFAVEIEEAKKEGKEDPNARKRYDPKEQYRGASPATASLPSPQSPASSP